jgi:hypothetical protein
MPTLTIEEKATQTYMDNISYLQEHDARLLEKISSFESALDHGHYEQRYELEYKEEGYFDVKELSTGKYFYGVSSQKYAQKAKKIVNFKKSESVFKTYYDYDFTEAELEFYTKKHDISSSSFYAYAEIMDYTKEVAPETGYMSEIKKFIFFGTGLGEHLMAIDEKIKAETYLIVEDDLELFRLSLFVTNYKELAKNAKLFFSVFEEENIAKIIFDNFLEKSFYYNHYIKYFQMQSSDDSKMKLMHTVVTGQRHLIFLYSSYFKVYLRALDYLKGGYNFLDMSGIKTDDTFLGKPVMIVAAGPSLNKNLDWLDKHRDKFVVVALTATLKILEKRGIKPDIITHLDPFEKTCMVHIDALESEEFIKGCILLCGSQTPKILLDKFEKEKIFLAQVQITYKKELNYLEPICVGSVTYMMLVMLGAREVYSLGMDLALDSETGMSHSKEHAYNKKLNTQTVDEIEDNLGYLSAVVKTKGNFQDEVYATLTFDKSIQVIKSFSKNYKKDFQNIYNLSDGAYLEGFEPTKISDVDIDAFESIDKTTYQKEFLKSIKNMSSNSMSKEELSSMKRRHEYAKSLISKIENAKSPQAFNKTLYQSQVLSLTLDILDEYDSEAWDLHNTYLSYLSFILPFVFDMLNTKNIKNEKRHIKKVHKLLIKYCLEIVEHYEEHVEKFFEEEKVS